MRLTFFEHSLVRVGLDAAKHAATIDELRDEHHVHVQLLPQQLEHFRHGAAHQRIATFGGCNEQFGNPHLEGIGRVVGWMECVHKLALDNAAPNRRQSFDMRLNRMPISAVDGRLANTL